MIKLQKTLPAPERPNNLDHRAQWLAGEGAGSWFVIEKAGKDHYRITRHAPDGTSECSGKFSTQGTLDLHGKYEITFPSHCNKVTVLQNRIKIVLRPVAQ